MRARIMMAVPGEVITKNKLRAAAVWMDEYADTVRHVMPPLPKGMDLGPLDFMQRCVCPPARLYTVSVCVRVA